MIWASFFVIVLTLLALDLGVFHRQSRELSIAQATRATIGWIVLGVSFTVVVYGVYEAHIGGAGIGAYGVRELNGQEAAVLYLSAYLVEKSLSVDNIFVIAMVFTYFRVPSAYQHKVLFWGILGAVVLRGVMIAIGAYLIAQLDWIFYVFGAFLLLTAVRILRGGDETIDPESSRILRWSKRILPIVERYDGERFTTRDENGKFAFTLLFLALIMVEISDVVFAVDSIPAVFGVTDDPFLVMTSNIFAILGLRALFFVVAGAMREYTYLNIAVAAVLVFVGIKMMLFEVAHIPAGWSLLVILVVLGTGIGLSIVQKPTVDASGDSASADPNGRTIEPRADDVE